MQDISCHTIQAANSGVTAELEELILQNTLPKGTWQMAKLQADYLRTHIKAMCALPTHLIESVIDENNRPQLTSFNWQWLNAKFVWLYEMLEIIANARKSYP